MLRLASTTPAAKAARNEFLGAAPVERPLFGMAVLVLVWSGASVLGARGGRATPTRPAPDRDPQRQFLQQQPQLRVT